MVEEDQDAALVARCLEGDQEAFETLLDRHQRAIYNLAYRMLASAEDAEDVTQTVFLKAFEKLDRYNADHRFFSWIYRIGINESIDALARRKRTEGTDVELESHAPSAEDQLDEADLCARVQAGLMKLRSDERGIIVLKHFMGISYREIGEVLEIEEKTVKSRLFVARRHLKEALEQAGEPGTVKH
jgi:RNA polymerase sigma-70 factor (ECF subfamily)